MLDGISSAGYNPYNYTKYNDDFLAQSYFNNYAPQKQENLPETKSDSVNFTGSGDKTASEQTQKEDNSSGHSLLWTAAIVAGAFLAGRYFNKIKGLFTKNAVTKISNMANQTLETAKKKAGDIVATNKKQKIKNTSVTGASNPITNEMEARAVNNINVQSVNGGNTRRIVADAADNVVTQQQQAVYDSQIAYKPMTKKQQKVNNTNNAKNTKQRAEMNSVKNNSKGGDKLEDVAQSLAKSEKAAAKITDGSYVNPFNNNTYVTTNGNVTKIILSNGNKEVTDPLKIAKHLDKYNIKIEEFATSKNQKLNIAA